MRTHIDATAPRCPHCTRELDRHTGVDVAPKAGDYTVCLACLALLRFAPWGLERVTRRELQQMRRGFRTRLERAREHARTWRNARN